MRIQFCPYCGTKLDEDAHFCKNCGEAIEVGNSAEPGTQREEPQKEYSSARKVKFEGSIYKCPNCGEVLDAFTSHCPSCGYEIRDAQSSSSVKELVQKLEEIDAERMAPIEERKSLMKMVFGRDFKGERKDKEALARFEANKQQQKINLIINFAVPNTREDILEFMILASSNIDVKNGIDDEVTKAWLLKLDQVYEKAKLLMGDKPSFAQIQHIYNCKKGQIKNKKYKGLATACFIVGGYILVTAFLFFGGGAESAIAFLAAGLAILAGGFKFVSVYNKNEKLNS